MSYIGKDGTGATKYWKSTGAGSIGDPYIPEHLETNSGAIMTSIQILDDIVYTEDAALGTPKGVPIILRRDDSLSTLTPVEDDAVVGRCNSRGAAWVIHDGAITANIGTSGSLALDATLTGGTQKSIVRGGAKGSTSAADVTSTASGSNHQGIDVVIYDTSGNAITSFGGGGTQYNEDDAHASGDKVTAAGFVRKDVPTSLQSADGDYGVAQINQFGQQHMSSYLVKNISVSVTASTTPAYASGDNVGGKLTLSSFARNSAWSGSITGAILIDQDKDMVPMELTLYNADPSGSTFTDNAVQDIADADMSKIIGSIMFNDYRPQNDNAYSPGFIDGSGWIDFSLASGTSLFGTLKTLGANQPAATSDYTIMFRIRQD